METVARPFARPTTACHYPRLHAFRVAQLPLSYKLGRQDYCFNDRVQLNRGVWWIDVPRSHFSPRSASFAATPFHRGNGSRFEGSLETGATVKFILRPSLRFANGPSLPKICTGRGGICAGRTCATTAENFARLSSLGIIREVIWYFIKCVLMYVRGTSTNYCKSILLKPQ